MIKNVFGGKLSRQLNYKHHAVARISRNIINIAKNIKTDTVKVAISGIIPRRDTFNLKAKQVSKYLKRICKEEKTSLILHHGSTTRFHLYSCGLHLNEKVLLVWPRTLTSLYLI